MRYILTVFLLATLGACGDPLAGIEKVENVELVQEEPVAQALPDAAEIEEEGGFLSRLMSRKPVPVEAATTEVAPAPPEDTVTPAELASETQASDVDAAVAAAQTATQTPEPAQGGLRGWLRRSADRAKVENVTQTPVVAEVIEPEIQTEPATEPAETVVAEVVPNSAAEVSELQPPTPVAVVEPEKRKGLLGLFKPAEKEIATVRTVSLSPTPEPATPEALAQPEVEAAVEPKKRRGIFGGATKDANRTGPDARDIGYGDVLPYGEVARVCSARNRPLGRKIDKAPARGRGYALYDSDPNSEAPRTFYVTGFADGCPRQFTAALALMGAPSLHEQLRYGRPSSEYPYSTTDKAYEKVKSAVCRVGKRKPCGAKIAELEKNTVFISTYERFGNNARWADILIHDGAVLAAAIKTP